MRNWTHAVAAALLAFALAAPSVAPAQETTLVDEETAQCLREAGQQAHFCRAECRENYQMDKDECLSLDHECAEVCRGDRNECLVAVYSEVEACRTPCVETLASRIETCRLNWPPDSDGRRACIQRAKLAGYRCTAQCRVGVIEEIRSCRLDHRQCLADCREETTP